MELLERLKATVTEMQDQGKRHDPEMMEEAIAEITRLRAQAFRWVPVSEPRSMDTFNDNALVALRSGEMLFWLGGTVAPSGTSHYLLVPPLPEQSQEQKDEELWLASELARHKIDALAFGGELNAKIVLRAEHRAFLAGLKAARGEKP